MFAISKWKVKLMRTVANAIDAEIMCSKYYVCEAPRVCARVREMRLGIKIIGSMQLMLQKLHIHDRGRGVRPSMITYMSTHGEIGEGDSPTAIFDASWCLLRDTRHYVTGHTR